MNENKFNVQGMDHLVKPYETLTVKEGELYNGWGNTIYKGESENIYTSEAVIEDWFTKPLQSRVNTEGGVIKVADFGGATGANLDVIKKQMQPIVVEPFNVDISFDAVKRGKDFGDDKNHVVANLASLPFADNNFDAGCSRSTIQYNPLVSEKVKTQGDILRELHRVMKPGGVIIMTWPGAKTKEMMPILNQASAIIEAYIMGVSERNILNQKCYTDPESLCELAKQAGFEIVEAKELLELPTTVEAYYNRFGEIIEKNGGSFEELREVYNKVINEFGDKLSTERINGKQTLIWSEHRLILKK